MKIGLDTNVIVSAVATRGLCADLFQLILLEHELIVGETVLAELRHVLKEKLGLPNATLNAIEALLRRQATVIPADGSATTEGLDAADAAVLSEAAGGSVDVLVTGDRDLLGLPDPAITIVSPRGLWELLRTT